MDPNICPYVGILLMQNEVSTGAVVKAAKIGHDAGKLVIFKASPIINKSDVPVELFGYCDIFSFILRE